MNGKIEILERIIKAGFPKTEVAVSVDSLLVVVVVVGVVVVVEVVVVVVSGASVVAGGTYFFFGATVVVITAVVVVGIATLAIAEIPEVFNASGRATYPDGNEV